MKSLMKTRQPANIRGNASQWARTLIAAALVLALAAAAFNAAYVAAQTPNLVFVKTPTPTITPTITPAQSPTATPTAAVETPTAVDETDQDQADQSPQVAALWGYFTGGASTATTRAHLLKTSVATYGDYDIHDVDGDYIHLSSFMRVLAAMRSQAAAALAIAEAQPAADATPAAAQ